MKKNLRKLMMTIVIIAVFAFVSGCGKTQQEQADTQQEAVETTTEQTAEAATQEAVEADTQEQAVEATTEQTAEAATQEVVEATTEQVAEEATTEEAKAEYDEKTHRVYFPDGLYFNWEHEDAPTEEELEDLLQFWKEHTE